MAVTQKLFINLDEPDKSQSLVTSFTSATQAERPIWYRGQSVPLELHFLATNPDQTDQTRPFIYVDAPTTIAALGDIDEPVDGGTFTLTDPAGAQTTTAIAYDAAAATVQTVIRATLTTSYSSATVTGDAGGPWTINRGAAGAITTMTASATALVPVGSGVVIDRSQTGDSAHNEILEIALIKAPAAKQDSWASLPSATVTPTVHQAGSATANKTFRVVWNADAYSGAVFFTFTGDTVAQSVGPIEYNATEEQILEAFERHTDVDDDGVAVVQNGPGDYTITCIGTGIKLSNTPALANLSNTLAVPKGLTGSLSLDTGGVSELLGDEEEITTVFEITVDDSLHADGPVVHIPDLIIRKDLVRNSPTYASTFTTPLTVDTGMQFLPAVTGYTGGGATNLDGIVTAGTNVPRVVCFVHSTDGIRFYKLQTGTDAESSPDIIRPDDYNASTNTKVWKTV